MVFVLLTQLVVPIRKVGTCLQVLRAESNWGVMGFVEGYEVIKWEL